MKRLMIKNKKVLYLVMDMLEYLSYQSELPFFSQISTKDFLLRISSLLQSKDLDEVVCRPSIVGHSEGALCYQMLGRIIQTTSRFAPNVLSVL